MGDAVLIFAPSDDLHALGVRHALQCNGIRCALVDIKGFPNDLSFQWFVSSSQLAAFMIDIGGASWNATSLHAIWYRRYGWRKDGRPLSNPTDEWLSRADSQHMIRGAAFTSGGVLPLVVNDPRAELVARNKLVQLSTAVSVGLRVPRTWTGSDPVAATSFVKTLWREGRQVIAKTFEAPPTEAVFSGLLTTERIDALALLRNAPALIQEFIDGEDLRVSVIGNQAFAARIIRSDSACSTDWRREYFPEVHATTIPLHLSDRIFALMRELGLLMGMFDFRVLKSGDFVFLEVNPQGQFLFIEVQTGQPITLSVASLLAGRHLSDFGQGPSTPGSSEIPTSAS